MLVTPRMISSVRLSFDCSMRDATAACRCTAQWLELRYELADVRTADPYRRALLILARRDRERAVARVGTAERLAYVVAVLTGVEP